MVGLRRNSIALSSMVLCFVVACAGGAPDKAEKPDVAALNQALTGIPPVNALPPPQTTNEDSPLTFSELAGNAIMITDGDNATSTVQITVANGVFFLGPVVNNVTVSGNGTTSVIVSGTLSVFDSFGFLIGGINKALNAAHYNPAANFNGATSLQINSSDSNGDVGFDVLDITVTSFNDSPKNNVPAGTQAATEDVPRAFTISVNDVDVGNAEMALTLSSTNGTLITLPTTNGLDFESGDGTADAALSFSGTLTDINAALNGLTVTPSANYAGASTLQIISDDKGASGAGAPGSDTDTINIDWGAVNDPPVNGVPGAQATVEEAPVTFSSANENALSVNDADGPTTLVQVTLGVTGGTLSLGAPGGVSFTAGDGTADASMTFRGTLFSLNTALASTVFTPTANFAGTAVVTMISNDLGNSGSGGAKQDTDTINITVSGINDAPVNGVPAGQITGEDVVQVFSNGNGNAITFADADAPTLQVTLTADHGTLTLATQSGLTFQTGDGNADGVMSFTGTIAQLNAAVNGLSFKPSPNFSGDASLTLLSSDRGATGSGGTLSDQDVIEIEVAPGNDAPDAVNDTLTVAEDAAAVVVPVLVNDTVLPDVGEALAIIGVSTPLHGTTSTDGNTVSYQPAANYAGADSFTYTVTDGNSGNDTATVLVTVTAVNDAPSAVTDTFTVLQNTGTTLSVLSNDSAAPDSGETLSVSAVSEALHGTPAIAGGGAAVTYTPNNGYTGPDSFTYTINDGNGGSASTTVNISVLAVNTSPVNTLPGPQTVSEDNQLFFSMVAGNAISVADSNNATLTVEVSVTNGTFTLGSTSGLTVSNNGSASVGLQGTIAALNNGLNNARYTPSPNYSGGASLSLNTADSSGESDLDVLTLTVTGLNDAPVNSVPSGVQSATEDTPKTFGTISISDVDVGGGQLLVSLGADNGTQITLSSAAGLAFSVGDGTADPNMTFTGSLPNINAALNGLTVTAGSNYIGTSALTLTTSDQGNTGGGGARQDVDSINISWVSVNDAPVNSVPGSQSIEEESPLTFALSSGNALRVSDVDVSGGLMQVTLSASTGTLTLGSPGAVAFNAGAGDGTADASMTFTGTLVAVNAALEATVYTPSANFSGTATLTLLASDLGNSGSGGAKTDSDTVSISIAGNNDAPVNTVPGAQNINEDVARVFTTANGNAISVADVDAASLQISLSVTSGGLTLPTKTGLTFQAGDGTSDASMTFTGTIASINAALNGLSFTPLANFSGATTLTVLTSDLGASGAGGTRVDEDAIAIAVSAANDVPDAVNDSLVVDEDAPATTVLVLANDSVLPDVGEALSIVAVSVPAHGTASLVEGGVAYTPAANYRGTDTFTYTIADGNGGQDTASVAVTVLSVNDSPTAADDAFSVLQNSGANALGVLSNDSAAPDSGETLSIIGVTTPASGAATITGGGSGLTYAPSAAFNGADSFTYTISDGNGGTSTATVSISVTAVNTKPVNTLPLPQTTFEDVSLFFSTTNGNPITVADSNNTALTVQISVTNGTFTMVATGGVSLANNSTSTVTAQGPITGLNAALNNSHYNPGPNYNGSSTLTINSSDTNGETDLDVLTLTVTSINDAPSNVVPSALQSATEDVPRTFSTISITDVDVGSGLLQVELTANNDTSITLGTPSGLLFTDGDGVADATMTFTGTLPAINTALNALSISAPPNFIGATSLEIVTSDLGNTGTGPVGQDSDTINLNWVAVNDPPINSVPGPQIAAEETPFVFSSAGVALMVSDADIGGGNMRITLSATNGTVSLGNPGLVIFTVGDGTADTTMTFTGTLATVNTALDGTTYTPALNFVGSSSVTLVANDQGNSGGTAASDNDSVPFTVAAVNDAPVNNVPGTQNTNEEVARVFSSGNSNAITVADSDGASLLVSLSASNGTLTLNTTSNLTFQAGDGTADASLAFTGTINALNAAMSGMRFIPTPNFNGVGSVTIQTNDQGLTGLGGARVDEDTINVNVASVNDAPNAADDAVALGEDAAPTLLEVLANDSDAPDSGEDLSITLVSTPAHGSASHDGQAVTYQPAANYVGTDTFTYTVNDGHGGTDTASVMISVTAVNDPPDAVDDAVSVAEAVLAGAAGQVINVLANDAFAPDLGETLKVTETSTPEHGTITIAGGGVNVTYKPAFGYNGSDTFTYTISDGNGGSDTAQASITVTSVDTEPAPVKDTLSVDEDSEDNPVDVLANDTGLSDGPIVVEIVTPPKHGTASVQSDNTIRYTPAPDYTGSDSLVYSATDADGDANNGDLAISVLPVGDEPKAEADSVKVDEDETAELDVLDNDKKLVDLPVKVTIKSEPEHGKAEAQDDGTVSYVPDENYHGDDAFEYTVTDADGSSSDAEVSIVVKPVNDAPTAMADSTATDPEVAKDIDVLDNDTDVDGDEIHVKSATDGEMGGKTEVNADGTIRYTPPADLSNANDAFSYTIVDEDGKTDTATVLVTVGIDSDEDGILDSQEEEYGTAVDDPDSDDDGIFDGVEVFTTHTDPLDDDSDDDGLIDGNEDKDQDGKVDEKETDPLEADTDTDTDGDGKGEAGSGGKGGKGGEAGAGGAAECPDGGTSEECEAASNGGGNFLKPKSEGCSVDGRAGSRGDTLAWLLVAAFVLRIRARRK